MTSSNRNIFRVTGPLCDEFTGPGEFPAQRPVARSFAIFFDLRLNEQLSKQWWGWWFETPSWPLWRHCNEWFLTVKSQWAQWRLESPAPWSSSVLLNRLCTHRSKKTSKPRVTGLCKGIYRWPVNFPHKGPVTRKMFPFYHLMTSSWEVAMPSTFVQTIVK